MKKIRIAFAAVAMAGVLAACGSAADNGSGSDTGDDGVASLGSTTTSPDGEEQTTETSVDPQEAMLAYTECMRDEGIDMPDPVMSEDGTGGGMVITREASGADDQGPTFDPDSEEFQAAEEKCSPIMEAAVGSIEVDPEQQAEMRAQLLEFAQCMRDQGVDFPDPEFGDNGRVTMGMGPDDSGDPPSEAEQEKMQEASEACSKDGGPIMMGAAPAGGQDD